MNYDFRFWLAILVILFAIAWIGFGSMLRQRRRERWKKRAFPPHWIAIIERYFPLYRYLPSDLKSALRSEIQVFLTEKNFIGCNGLQITDEVKLAIASQACLLLLHRRSNYFASLKDILVYPSAFYAKSMSPLGNLYLEGTEARSGESWQQGMVIFSWEDIERDRDHWHYGRNVIFHEFAHQLDQENGRANGVPILSNGTAYARWSQVFSSEYYRLCDQVQRGEKTAIDEYGATSPAEFFAVATETFFEKPNALKVMHPDLYQELVSYYRCNPVEWFKSPQDQHREQKSRFI